jgi:hypothetical protein
MTTTFPRRFVIAAPPSATAWIVAVLNRAFRCPQEQSRMLDQLIGQLNRCR